MPMPKVAPTTTTQPAQPEAAQKTKGFKGFKNPFATQAQPAQSKMTARPMGSDVFAEAGQTKRSGGFGKAFSRGLRFMTASHPDTVRNRAENVGATFAARVDKFENGKGGGFMGPLFGTGFKTYDRAGGHAPAPFAQGAGPGPQPASTGIYTPFAQAFGTAQATPPQAQQAGAQQPASPFVAAQSAYPAFNSATFAQQTQHIGTEFASRLDAFSRHGAGPEGPLSGLGSGRMPAAPAPGTATYAAPNYATAQQQAADLGSDFSSRVNAHTNSPTSGANPFAGMGQTQSAAPAHSASTAQAATPATMTNQQRIDGAKAEFRAAQTRLGSELNDAKNTATETATIAVSAAEARIQELGDELDSAIRDIERRTETGTQELEDRIAALKLQQKEVRKEMLPLREASAAGGTNARADVALDPETAAKKARFSELMQLQTSLRDQIEAAADELENFTRSQAELRSNLMDRTESEMIDLQEEIRTIKSGLEASLKQLDDGYAANIAQEKARISEQFGVRFR